MAKKKQDAFRSRVELRQFTDSDSRPKMAIYLLDKTGRAIETTAIGDKGEFELSTKGLKAAHRVFVGPMVEELSEEQRSVMTSFRPQHFANLIESAGVIDIARSDWYGWIHVRRCIGGSVRHCTRFPWFTASSEIATANISRTASLAASDRLRARRAVPNDIVARPLQPVFSICRTVCDGVVEVYRRICCCHPWIVYDPRIPELIKDLEDLIPIPWPDPPIPIPDPVPDPFPGPPRPFLKSGALDRRVLNAERDLKAIRSLPPAEVPAYINARPYLWCSCGTHAKVAEGFIQPDGDFHICWWEWPTLLRANCHEEYAFVVKQNIDGNTVVIYDGVGANQWFESDEDITLTSYHADAITCGEDDVPGEGAFALLQDIGLTHSYNLKTPASTGWDRVANPVYNDGLAYPVTNPADAVGKYRNRNWGGVLRLRYHFSEDMKGIGARYFRISVVAADANGNPTGTRTYLAPPQWKYYEVVFPDIFVRKTALGPHSAGGQHNLYEIPYRADAEWLSGQYHAILDTRNFNDGRWLLTVEVFNSSGQLIRPSGTSDPGGSVQGAFTYRRWYQETGPTAEVPFAALTHMLWWDNRSAQADIVDFRLNGFANTAECQFLEGSANSNFSVGYRAYHPEPMFLLYHSMWWRRGLGGPTGTLTSPHPNPDNVGVPPAAVHVSATPTLASMLGSHTKCTFTVNLRSYVKTFNGIGTVDHNGYDQGSMALGIV